MDTKQVILELRTQKGMSQDELAEKVFVSRQAVSRWENGETVPNTETLKLLSKVFDVSINTLLGSPRKLICQCCGMPLEDDDIIGHNHDGSFNEDYCKWCYADGTYTYNDMDDCLCPKCLNDYIHNPDYIVRRLDPFAKRKDRCDKCDGDGWDYVVTDRYSSKKEKRGSNDRK